MARPLHFPNAFRAIRTRLGLLQKTVALELRVDPAVLCSIEKGARAPLDDTVLAEAARLFRLTNVELAELCWAARHDRMVSTLSNRGATDEEVELISAALFASHHLRSEQLDGLIYSMRRVGESAQLVSSLTSPQGGLEVSMT
ncbi:MAG: helix-turn-helix transcriptional regulator [Burkholderiales bacterium]|nr:helix-turn-helix transcriptional regulator [Burkholderiales bacterium]